MLFIDYLVVFACVLSFFFEFRYVYISGFPTQGSWIPIIDGRG